MNQSLRSAQTLPHLSAMAMDLSGEGMIITDAHTNILATNPAMCNITGYSKEQIIGSTPRLFKSGVHGSDFYKRMWQDLRNKGAWQGDVYDRRPNGELASRRLRIKAVHDQSGKATHYIGLMRDTSELTTMTNLAYQDCLTCIPNRRLFEERLQQAVIRSKRTGKAFALLYADLDQFKKINDTWGHNIGDKILETVAQRLHSTVREEDTVARLGGDEFAIILLEVGTRRNTELVRAKLTNKLNEPCTINHHQFTINCSIGYSLYPNDSKDTKRLLTLADQDMYAYKKAG